MNLQSLAFLLLAVALTAGLLAAPAAAQEETAEESPTWTHSAEVSFVATGGNSEGSTLGLRYAVDGKVGGGTLSGEASALRAESTTTSRVAFGTPGSFTIQETSNTVDTAENYLLRGRFERPVSERLFWFAGASWYRNEFAGIKSRSQLVGGIGHVWYEGDDRHFKTDYGLTYTDQEDVVDDPSTSDTYAGFRLGWDYLRPFGANTSYGNVLNLDGNADETSDYRALMTNWLAVSMSERLALKVSLDLLYDNSPSLAELPLFVSPPQPTIPVVLAPLDKLDTVLSVALVLNF